MVDHLDARVARTRHAVLDAGAKLLFTDGWDAVTHLRVAEESGVGRATIYRHWPTVEDLLADVLMDCQAPLVPDEPTGDLRHDLISAVRVFVEPLHTSKLGEVLVAAIDRAPSDPRIRAMHDAMTTISRRPVWDVANAAIEQGSLDSSLTEGIVAAHTIGPILYGRLFDQQEISERHIERTIDAFLAAFTS
ncbi:TetR/AcrR family transcriptional regulator [bacterium]|nr:TetR/AcrR family transcriptional regulator [bacterium]